MKNLVATLFIFFSTLCMFGQTAAEYSWRNVPIGAGGYITGMRIHPMAPHHKYYRTDVGGAYRRDDNQDRLVQLFDFGTEFENYYSVAGITFDPTNPQSVIMAVDRKCSDTYSAILVSTDAGENWTVIQVPFYFAANGGRNCTGNNSDKDREGNCIEVNPLNTNEIYIGTRDKGLWILDLTDPQNPVQVSDADIPHNTERLSIRSVSFHPTQQNKVLVGYAGHGVYLGDTADDTWQQIDQNIVALELVQDLSLSVSGNTLYAACVGEGIYKCENVLSANRTWTQVLTYTGNDRGYLTVTASPYDEQTLITVQNNWDSYDDFRVSYDGGVSWTNPGGTVTNIFPWKTSGFGSNCSQIVFDPVNQTAVYISSFFGSYMTSDFTASPIAWSNDSNRGHEEVVNVEISAFPENSAENFLLLMDGDHTGFVYDDISEDNFPQQDIRSTLDDGANAIKGGVAAYCENASDNIVVCLPKNWNESSAGLAYSEDGGVSFTRSTTYNEAWGKSVLALSSGDANRLVIANQEGLWWEDRNTANGFTQSTLTNSVNGNCESFSFNCLAPSNMLSDSLINPSVFSVYRPLASDKVMSCVFYYYNQFDGTFHVSTDNGESWCMVNDQLPAISNVWANKIEVNTIPGQAGHVYINFRDSLIKSIDGGQTWSGVTHVQGALCFGYGKEKPGETYAALYIFGKANGDNEERVYLSWDQGLNWVQINDTNEDNWGNPAGLAGDRNVYGQVYLGVGGMGVFVGEYSPGPFISMTSPAGGDEVIKNSTIEITWESNIDFNGGLTVWQGPSFVEYLGQVDIETGSYQWTVPSSLADGQYEIRLKSLDGSETQDYTESFNVISTCPSDINGDGTVDINDFLSFNSAFGSSCDGCPEDINQDGIVDINDFLALNSAFSNPCQ